MSSALECDLFLYADDSFLFVSGPCINELQTSLQNNMIRLSKWLAENKLTLHPSKCKSILFATKRKLKKCSNLDIVFNNIPFESCKNVKYLGVKLDQDLSGISIWDSIIGKVNGGLKFLYRKACFLNQNERKLLVNALLQPRFDYACNSWYWGLTKYHKNRLQTLQNKMVRFILRLDNRSHLDASHFDKTKFLKVENRVNYLAASKIYDVYTSTAPEYLNEFLCKVSEVHSHYTRQSHGMYINRVNSNGMKSFFYNSSQFWNKLPKFFMTLNKSLFKKKCKQFLFNKVHEEEDVR